MKSIDPHRAMLNVENGRIGAPLARRRLVPVQPAKRWLARVGTLTVVMFVLSASPASAQLLDSLPGKPLSDAQYDPDKPKLYFLSLSAQREPVPALTYQFTRTPRDTRSGNAANHYYRAVTLMLQLPEESGLPPDINQWLKCDLNEFPVEKAAALLEDWQRIFTELRFAARCEKCDWNLSAHNLNSEEYISFGLSEFQNMRRFEWMLYVQQRHALATGNRELAFESIQIGYRMAEDLGETPWIINSLIGLAIAGINHELALEWMQNDNCGNLYWAYASLPRPLVGMRKSLHNECLITERMLKLSPSEAANPSPEIWKGRINSVFDSLLKLDAFGISLEPIGAAKQSEWLTLATGLRGYSDSRRGLARVGVQHVDEMPVGRVLWMQTERSSRMAADTVVKSTYLPHHHPIPKNQNVIDRWGFTGTDIENREPLPMISLLLPALDAARNAELRLAKRIAALQTIEAIRDYAARNNSLPRDLDALSLPAMLDPETNQPFYYEVGGKRAVLREAAPQRLPQMLGRDYIITLK